MECLYSESLDKNSTSLTFVDKDFKHIKALRLSLGDFINITNGKGDFYLAEIEQLEGKTAKLKILKHDFNIGELDYKLGLVIGVLDDRTRFEFLLEKAVELRVTDLYPTITQFTEKKRLNYSRLLSKSIAALKQTKRSNLITIHPIQKFKKIDLSIYNKFILTDDKGDKISNNILKDNILAFVGPEGGFSEDEKKYIIEKYQPNIINLGNRRLRAETAAISILSFLSNL